MLKQPQLRRCTISISTIWKRISVHCCEQEKKKGKENGKKTSNCRGTNCFCPFVTTAVSSWACLSLPTLEHICRLGKPFHFHWIFCVQSYKQSSRPLMIETSQSLQGCRIAFHHPHLPKFHMNHLGQVFGFTWGIKSHNVGIRVRFKALIMDSKGMMCLAEKTVLIVGGSFFVEATYAYALSREGWGGWTLHKMAWSPLT